MLHLKVCGMRAPENIEALLALRPDYIGFIFYPPSPRYVGEVLPEELARQIHGVKKVGVFVNEEPIEILRQASRYGLDLIQLHGQEPVETCRSLRNAGFQVIKAISVKSAQDVSDAMKYDGEVDFFLFDTKGKAPGGNGEVFDWTALREFRSKTPYFLSGGLDETSITQLHRFNIPVPFGVDVNSKFERAPGDKDIPAIKQLMNSLGRGKSL
ncbi:phosphoribosylanthranilate isomerase [Pontibacter sp. G13]|uniref:phosphoribosylanthranilate isomerase n=1 Tax=Pontibacter sp. G13 TaxID=3074898 RepID=UPI0028891447|nr:phosphoribosylanthranilate isomerase [Pontibacter sp. G13]WNJ19582.1 phosphoribosylanthranilate isomerase [Pontibacter sp. G13]